MTDTPEQISLSPPSRQSRLSPTLRRWRALRRSHRFESALEPGCHKDRRARERGSRPPGGGNRAAEVLLEPQADREPVWIADGVADRVVARLDLEGGGAGLSH